jgi:hypothetical protein
MSVFSRYQLPVKINWVHIFFNIHRVCLSILVLKIAYSLSSFKIVFSKTFAPLAISTVFVNSLGE